MVRTSAYVISNRRAGNTCSALFSLKTRSLKTRSLKTCLKSQRNQRVHRMHLLCFHGSQLRNRESPTMTQKENPTGGVSRNTIIVKINRRIGNEDSINVEDMAEISLPIVGLVVEDSHVSLDEDFRNYAYENPYHTEIFDSFAIEKT